MRVSLLSRVLNRRHIAASVRSGPFICPSDSLTPGHYVSVMIEALKRVLVLCAVFACARVQAQSPLSPEVVRDIARRTEDVMPQVIAWRRDIHQHPELSNREFRTSALVAAHLRELGLTVRTGVAHTGVVAVLKGDLPGPVVALRADMDALPVVEQVDIPFASRVRTLYNGDSVGVMHACGHDAHVAILLGVADVLVGMRHTLRGSVKFIFQPAEEGPPSGESGGSSMMISEGALGEPVPSAIFGLHVVPSPAGNIEHKDGAFMAAADRIRIIVRGRQTHGARPWAGVDPIAISAQIIMGLQTIVSRQLAIVTNPAVITIGTIHAGNRGNIIPDSVEMVGTLRTFDPTGRRDAISRMQRTVELIASSGGGTATITVDSLTPVTINDSSLTQRMIPVLAASVKKGSIARGTLTMASEDFGYYQRQIPGMFFFLGIAPRNADPSTVAPNHSPRFFVDESALSTGVRALAGLAFAYLSAGSQR